MNKRNVNEQRIYIEESLIGVFGITEENRIIEKTLYPPHPEQIATALAKQSNGEITREISDTIEKLRKRGFNIFVFTNRALGESVESRFCVKVELKHKTRSSNWLKGVLESLAVEHGFATNISDFYSMSHKVSMTQARTTIRKIHSNRELIIIRAVQLLIELDKFLNILSNKLREWYGIHFPELSNRIADPQIFTSIINAFGERSNFKLGSLKKMGLKDETAKNIIESALDSIGAPMGLEDMTPVQQLSSFLTYSYEHREGLEKYLRSVVYEVAPNLSEVAGPLLASKLIEKAGGLKKLAFLPSSKIQILGAEKAIFRAKKTKGKPPKHGLIFQHPYVNSRNRQNRGRAARIFAAKLAIAARADAFSGRKLGAQLKKELNESNIVRKKTM